MSASSKLRRAHAKIDFAWLDAQRIRPVLAAISVLRNRVRLAVITPRRDARDLIRRRYGPTVELDVTDTPLDTNVALRNVLQSIAAFAQKAVPLTVIEAGGDVYSAKLSGNERRVVALVHGGNRLVARVWNVLPHARAADAITAGGACFDTGGEGEVLDPSLVVVLAAGRARDKRKASVAFAELGVGVLTGQPEPGRGARTGSVRQEGHRSGWLSSCRSDNPVVEPGDQENLRHRCRGRSGADRPTCTVDH